MQIVDPENSERFLNEFKSEKAINYGNLINIFFSNQMPQTTDLDIPDNQSNYNVLTSRDFEKNQSERIEELVILYQVFINNDTVIIMDDLSERIGKLLEGRESTLKTKKFSMGSDSQKKIMNILPAIDENSLTAIELLNLSNTNFKTVTEEFRFEVDQISQTKQWKSAEQLISKHLTIITPIQEMNVLHFADLEILVEALSSEDVAYLKTNLLKSSSFQKFKISFLESTVDESLHTLIGQPYRTSRAAIRIYTDKNGVEHRTENEVNSYLDGRYVCAPESLWHIFDFRMSDRSTPVMQLKVHLKNAQGVAYKEGEEKDAAERGQLRETTLTAWFAANKRCYDELESTGMIPEDVVDCRGIYYVEMPEHFQFTKGKWTLRKNATRSIGRMHFVSPRDQERFALRVMLLNVTDAKSYEDLQTVGGVFYEKFVDAAKAAGYLTEDIFYEKSLEEAASFHSAPQLRGFFVTLLMFGEIHNAEELWYRFVDDFSEDFLYKHFPKEKAEALAYNDLIDRMNSMGENLDKWMSLGYERIIPDDVIDFDYCSKEGDRMRSTLVAEQEEVVKSVLDAVKSGGGLIYVDGPGGSGKTYTNMRAQNADEEWKSFLLGIGDGLKGEEGTGVMEVPEDLRCDGDLAEEIFGSLLRNGSNVSEISKVAILSPTNQQALQMNQKMMEMVPGEMKTYFSVDEVGDNQNSHSDAANFPTEFLNKMTPSGLPPHKLERSREFSLVKYMGDPRITNPLICCTDHSLFNSTVTSKLNPTPVILYTRGAKQEITLKYRFIDRNLTDLPKINNSFDSFEYPI
ncbi:hypothetical protein L5515_009416 [Caenorhabditis briggsae]|uniref:DUF38 domain-containing protein n=1 Tax=Caenorhabditis briggsae TaxID=6238 RepID=A0AAE9F7Y2_CAEBR|nr:hypothetical protein L5515_009416 [Caenorhabditis briggsae]